MRNSVRPSHGLPDSTRGSLLWLVFLDLTAMAEQQQFYILLGNLMSPDNNVRKHSEVREDNIAVY